jgi:hypothetical protein
MSVTLPAAFVVLDQSVDYSPGVAVAEGMMDDLGANANDVYGRWSPTICAVMASGANGWEPLQTAYGSQAIYLLRPGCADLRTVVVTVTVHDKGDPGGMKVRVTDGGGATAESAALTGNVEQTVELEIASTADPETICVEGKTVTGPATACQILSVSVRWKGYSGAIAAARTSGVKLVGAHETGADYPVTDELLYRMARNPGLTWADARCLVLAGATQNDSEIIAITTATRTPQTGALVVLRWPCTLRWYVYAVSAGDWALEIDGGGDTVTVTQASSTLASGVTLYYADGDYEAGEHLFALAAEGDGANEVRIFGIFAEVRP